MWGVFIFAKKGVGCIAKYNDWLTPEALIKIEGWARDGLTDEQISIKMGINPATLYEWKKKYPEFSESLKKGKEVVDRMVENALLKRALGYSYTETTKEYVVEKGEMIITKEVIKEVIPDTTAQIFWLKNRKPNEWRNNPEAGINNNEGVQIIDDVPRANESES